MTNLRPAPRRSTSRLLAVALGALLVGPLGWLPAPAPASAAAMHDSSAPDAETTGGLPAAGPKASEPPDGPAKPPDRPRDVPPVAPPGGPPDPADAEAPAGDLQPSIHYREDQAHAKDVLALEPGGLVTVPFSPRANDQWKVDGRAPRKLPAGLANGRQMHDAKQGSVWSAAAPANLAGADPAATDGGLAPDDGRFDAELASVVTTPTDEPVAAAPVSANGLRREVFGFLPYWELSDSSTVLDWRTLSTLAYFSVGCTDGGSLQKRNADGSITTGWAGWTSSRMTSIINAAHEHQTRVVLTVSCFAWNSSGATTQARLLGSATARANLARQIAAAVRDRGADGVNLDFEPLVAGYAEEFTALVRRVRAELNAVAPGYQLTFDTLGSNGNQPIEAATAPGGADAVFIMGYDYRTAGAATAGSISPLTGPAYDLTDTLRAYTARISPSKVILGVPYYGRAWSTSSDAPNAKNISGAKYGGSSSPTYAQVVDIVAAHGRRWDSVEQAPWTAYRKQTCTATYGCVTSWRELYYDDAASLRLRYDLVNRAGLRGAGIWALGYDNTRPELRTALADKFITDRTPPVAGIVTLAEQQYDQGFRVAWTSYDDSPIRSYDVQVAIDGGAWRTWLIGTTLTSGIHLGSNGHTYAFRVRATDVRGNVSSWKAGTATGVPVGITVGGFAKVVTDGLRMRTRPSTDASVLTTLSAGDALHVIGGPASAQGYTWYQVAGPMRQWPSVDAVQVGGWVAASGNGVVNASPRRPLYATRINAGIHSLRLNDGGERVITPNADGKQDRLRLTWTNRVAFDGLTMRVYRTDGTHVGSVNVPKGSGGQVFSWDARIAGGLVPAGSYVIALRGVRGSTVYSAPSATPVNSAQIAHFGVIVGPRPPTSVMSFTSSPTSPTRSGNLAYTLNFGGSVRSLATGDFFRSGTATGCRLGAPAGAGRTWSIAVTGCSAGSVVLTLKARSVTDAVANLGPASSVSARKVIIDRSAPTTSRPKVSLRTGGTLASAATNPGLAATLGWSATDPGGAGVRDYDVRRSVDGGAWKDIAVDVAAVSMGVTLLPGHSYRFVVRARDKAGNVSGWALGPTIRPSLLQNTSSAIVYSGAWKLGSGPRYSGGNARYAAAAGASARYTFLGRGFALVSSRGPDRGTLRIYVDGALAATVNTHATAAAYRQVIFSRTWTSSGWHTIRVVAVGTTGHPRVDLDAFELLR